MRTYISGEPCILKLTEERDGFKFEIWHAVKGYTIGSGKSYSTDRIVAIAEAEYYAARRMARAG